MEKIKKLNLILVLTLILSIGFVKETYAVLNCNTSISVPAEVTQGEEIEVSVGISNIQGENGVLVFGGTVEYDKNKLTYVGRSGEGDWSLSYNTSTGKFVADRDNGFAKNNETVFTLKFKVNENVTGNANITVKNAAISDAKEESNIAGVTKTITIKAKSTNNPSGGNNQGGSQGNNGNQNQGGNQGGNSNQGNNGNQNQGGNQGGNSNQGSSGNQGVSQGSNGSQVNNSNNASQNKPITSNQGNSTNNNNNDENKNSEANNNGIVTGIDGNRVDEENTVSNDETVVKQTDYTSKEEPVKLYKQKDNSIIVYSICAAGVIVIIGVCVFAKKKIRR